MLASGLFIFLCALGLPSLVSSANLKPTCRPTPITYLKEALGVNEDYESLCFRLGDVFDEHCYSFYQNRMHSSVSIMERYFSRLKTKDKTKRPTFEDYERDVIFNYAFNIAPALEKKLIYSKAATPPTKQRVEIPKIIHKFWVTNPKNPHPIPDLYAEILRNDTGNLGSDWEIVIWVWSERDLVECLEKVKSSAVNAKIKSKSIQDESYLKGKRSSLEKLLSESKYSTVITQVKFDILDQYGGAYCDMDVRILRNLDPLLSNTQSFLFLSKGFIYHLSDCFFMQTKNFGQMNRKDATEKLMVFLEQWGRQTGPHSRSTLSLSLRSTSSTWRSVDGKGDFMGTINSRRSAKRTFP